jgi:ectoine hydroxylase-related dioxygenase (phytanoyl-CoA dioxygenase family)
MTAAARLNPRLGELTVDPGGRDVAAEVLDRVRRHGIAVLPAMLADRLDVLRAEFDVAFETEQAAAQTAGDGDQQRVRPRFEKTSTGRKLTLDRDAKLSELASGIHEVFSTALFRDIARSFLGSPSTINRHVILTDDDSPSEQVLGFHFDELNALKCYVYLDDIDEHNAPFQVIPGTQAQARMIRQAEWMRVDDFRGIRTLIFDEFSEEFFYSIFGMFKGLLLSKRRVCTAPAGTVLIFDTDMLHSAGPLGEGRRRRVIRGTSYYGLWPRR